MGWLGTYNLEVRCPQRAAHSAHVGQSVLVGIWCANLGLQSVGTHVEFVEVDDDFRSHGQIAEQSALRYAHQYGTRVVAEPNFVVDVAFDVVGSYPSAYLDVVEHLRIAHSVALVGRELFVEYLL